MLTSAGTHPERHRANTVLSPLSPVGSRCLRLVCLALAMWLVATGTGVAGERSEEFWPEMDVWLRLSPVWRVSTFISLSRNIETAYREGSLSVQADYAWGKPGHLYRYRLLDEGRAERMKAWLTRGGYYTGKSLADNGLAYREKTVFLELHVRSPLEGGILVSQRLRTDLRWLGSHDPDFSQRWRYRVRVEKEYTAGRSSIVPYLSVEPYYDSRYGTVNRVRLIGGGSVAWSPHFALEGNLTYQHDSRLPVTNLFALNAIVNLFFETRHAP